MREYTPQETAVLADANLRTVQKAISEKRITARRKGGRRLVDETNVYTMAVMNSAPSTWKISAREIDNVIIKVLIKGDMIGRAHVKMPGYPPKAPHLTKADLIPLDTKGAWVFDPNKILPVVWGRLQLYEKAKGELIERNPDILGGTPVIKGTRLNVYAVAARLDGGETVEELLKDYPYVSKEKLEAARLYAKANPLRGRPGGRPWLKKKTRSS